MAGTLPVLSISEKLLLAQAVTTHGTTNWNTIQSDFVNSPHINPHNTTLLDPDTCKGLFEHYVRQEGFTLSSKPLAPKARTSRKLVRTFFISHINESHQKYFTNLKEESQLLTEIRTINSGAADQHILASLSPADKARLVPSSAPSTSSKTPAPAPTPQPPPPPSVVVSEKKKTVEVSSSQEKEKEVERIPDSQEPPKVVVNASSQEEGKDKVLSPAAEEKEDEVVVDVMEIDDDDDEEVVEKEEEKKSKKKKTKLEPEEEMVVEKVEPTPEPEDEEDEEEEEEEGRRFRSGRGAGDKSSASPRKSSRRNKGVPPKKVGESDGEGEDDDDDEDEDEENDDEEDEDGEGEEEEEETPTVTTRQGRRSAAAATSSSKATRGSKRKTSEPLSPPPTSEGGERGERGSTRKRAKTEDTDREADLVHFRRSMNVLFDTLDNSRSSQAFRTKVTKGDAPNYNSAVKRPIWLKEVVSRFKKGKSSDVDEVMRDVGLLCANAVQFNGVESEVGKNAAELWGEFENLMQRHLTLSGDHS